MFSVPSGSKGEEEGVGSTADVVDDVIPVVFMEVTSDVDYNHDHILDLTD